MCDLFAQLDARGVSVLFPTGDYGVGGKEDEECVVGDGSRDGGSRFLPATCTCVFLFLGSKRYRVVDISYSQHHHAFVGPYVTSVGGTTKKNPEVAASLSGGGF